MKIRKILNVFTAVLLAVMLLASCGSSNDVQVMRDNDSDEQTISQTAKEKEDTTTKPADKNDTTTAVESETETNTAVVTEPTKEDIVPFILYGGNQNFISLI
jgi:hypothetical protein